MNRWVVLRGGLWGVVALVVMVGAMKWKQEGREWLLLVAAVIAPPDR